MHASGLTISALGLRLNNVLMTLSRREGLSERKQIKQANDRKRKEKNKTQNCLEYVNVLFQNIKLVFCYRI